MTTTSGKHRPAKSGWLVAAAFAGALAAAQPAMATPPDHVTIVDTPFAIGDDAYYVLRQSTDNLGLHTAQRVEVWLVAIDPQTGAETLWPVTSATRRAEWDAAAHANRWEVETHTPAGAVDPFTLVAEKGAIPLPGFPAHDAPRLPQPETRGTDIVVEDPPDRRFAFPLDSLRARYNLSVEKLSERVAEAGRMAPVSTRAVFLGTIVEDGACEAISVGWAHNFGAAGARYQPVRVTCRDEWSMEPHALIQLLPLKTPGEPD